MANPNQIPSESTKRLLAKLEDIIANSFYSRTAKNFSGHDELDDGRWFRYPITIDSQGKPSKYRNVYLSLFDDKEFVSARYVMGTNQLYIVQGLLEVLRYLEQNHGLVLPADPPPPSPEDLKKRQEGFAETNQRLRELLGENEVDSGSSAQP